MIAELIAKGLLILAALLVFVWIVGVLATVAGTMEAGVMIDNVEDPNGKDE